jgi:replication fork protection complex subunit Csm3/Swi3
LDLNVEGSEPVKVQKKTVRNLNEDHLLSLRGLKYIKENAGKKLKPAIKHKNEYKNLTNLLSFYQLWGHGVFPRANFDDFTSMCSTVGNKSSRVISLRAEWINEETSQNDANAALYTHDHENTDNNHEKNKDHVENDHEEDDHIDFTIPREDQNGEDDLVNNTSTRRKNNNLFFDDEDEFSEDELYTVSKKTNSSQPNEAAPLTDYQPPIFVKSPEKAADSDILPNTENGGALLSQKPLESPVFASTQLSSKKNPEQEYETPLDIDFEDEFEAEMEAMRDMEGLQ